MRDGPFSALWLSTMAAIVTCAVWFPGAVSLIALGLWFWVLLERQRAKDAIKLADERQLQNEAVQRRFADFQLRWGSSQNDTHPPST